MARNFLTPFKVGLLVLLAGAAFVVFFTFFLAESGVGDADGTTVFAYFRDASGLSARSRVQTAGIQVGEIVDVKLEGTQARVTLRVRGDVPLKRDAGLVKRAESLLGDYLLDLVPGSEEAEPMPDGGQILRVVDQTGMDQVFDRMNLIAADIQAVTASLREVLGGPEGAGNLEKIMENLVQLSTAMDVTVRDSGERLNLILANLDGFTSDLRQLTMGEGDNYRQIVENVRWATQDVRDVMVTVKQIVGSGQGDLKESVASLKQTLYRLDATLASVQSVAAKVDSGDGTLAKLINDKELGDDLHGTVTDVNDYVGRMMKLVTEVTLRSEYLVNQGGAQTHLQLRLIPKPDKYYFFEVVDDPRGQVVETTVQRIPPDADQQAQQTLLTTEHELKFSAQFAKRYYWLTMRFGIFESTGGVGANAHLLDDSLSFTVDVFDFAARHKDFPRVKAYANYSLLGHIYLTAGIDDALNDTLYDVDFLAPGAIPPTTRKVVSGRDFFFGAGVYFNDDDIKALAGTVSMSP